jgi:hypothetical protein
MLMCEYLDYEFWQNVDLEESDSQLEQSAELERFGHEQNTN